VAVGAHGDGRIAVVELAEQVEPGRRDPRGVEPPEVRPHPGRVGSPRAGLEAVDRCQVPGEHGPNAARDEHVGGAPRPGDPARTERGLDVGDHPARVAVDHAERFESFGRDGQPVPGDDRQPDERTAPDTCGA
jgi:hypothetical protein